MLSQLTYKEYLKVTIPFIFIHSYTASIRSCKYCCYGTYVRSFYIAAVSLGVILFNNIYWLFGFLRVSTTVFRSSFRQ